MPTKKDKDKEALRKLDIKAIIGIYRKLSEKANIAAPSGEWGLIRSHNMRKYFNSALLNANVPIFFVDYLMGHTLDTVHDAYFRPDSEQLREQYMKYVPYLTIQKEVDISESPEYVRIKQENQILQTETARHVVERHELQELRAEMEEMKEVRDNMESIKADYLQFADLEEIRDMKNSLKQELEEISQLKEQMFKAGK
jgi:hypothetical protein